MTQAPGGQPPDNAVIMERLEADREWLAAQGVELAQYGPDPDSGKVQVYLAHYTEQAHQLLADRYGPAIVVAEEARSWRFT